MKNEPQDAAARAAQERRIEHSLKNFVEDFLAGDASIEVRPLAGADSLAANVGGATGMSVLNGFAIRLCPAAK